MKIPKEIRKQAQIIVNDFMEELFQLYYNAIETKVDFQRTISEIYCSDCLILNLKDVRLAAKEIINKYDQMVDDNVFERRFDEFEMETCERVDNEVERYGGQSIFQYLKMNFILMTLIKKRKNRCKKDH